MESSYGLNAKKISILLADDYEDTRCAYADAALEAGFAVEIAGDGLEALALALVVHPDLVITEAMLGGIDGFELAQRMGRNPRAASIPVIMLTGLMLPDLKARARASGCAALLTKPCTFEALERTMRRVIRERGVRAARPA